MFQKGTNPMFANYTSRNNNNNNSNNNNNNNNNNNTVLIKRLPPKSLSAKNVEQLQCTLTLNLNSNMCATVINQQLNLIIKSNFE